MNKVNLASVLIAVSWFCITSGVQSQSNELTKDEVSRLRDNANQGNPQSQTEYADCFSTLFIKSAEGIKRDDREAFRWYKKAAEQGYAKAEHALSCYYYTGTVVSKDQEESVKWEEKAANKGLPEAQWGLGVTYAIGAGVSIDPKKAKEWMIKAAANEAYYVANKKNIDGWLKRVSDESPGAQYSQNKTQSPVLKPIIKGLAIGMNFGDLNGWFLDKLHDTVLGFVILREGDSNVFLMAKSDSLNSLKALQQSYAPLGILNTSSIERYLLGFKESPPSVIVAGPDGKVLSVTLRSNLVNYLFRSDDIEFLEFITIFTDAYKMGQMKTDAGLFSRPWTSAEGVKITIDSDKTIVIKKVVPPANVKGSFN